MSHACNQIERSSDLSVGSVEPDISVIIPVLNEAEGIEHCFREVVGRLALAPYSFELLFVDDGSTDGSSELLRAIAARDSRVTVIKLLHNIGQQHAMFIAMRFAEGKVVITYDADLQFHPDCLPDLAAKVLEGYDVVGGIRVNRRDPLLLNRFPSWVGRKLINNALRTNLVDFGGVKAYSARMVRMLRTMDAPRIVVPALAYSISRNIIEIPVRHEARQSGRSKWSILSRMELYLDVYTLFARRPFAWMMFTGLAFMTVGVLLGLGIVLYGLLWTNQFGGLIIFFDLFLMAMGLHFFSLSMIGEFVVRSFRTRRLQPQAVVQELVSQRRREPLAAALSKLGTG